MPLNRSAISEPSLASSAGVDSSWATSSVPRAAETAPMELSALGDHVDHCNGSRSAWFSAKSAADRLAGFIASRLVSAVVLVVIIFGVASFVS